MGIFEKHYDVQYGQDNYYNIDPYVNIPIERSLEINRNGNIQLKNI